MREFRRATDELLEMGCRLMAIDGATLQHAARLSTDLGLLTNDATTLALMQHHGLVHLATNDDDFDAIPNLTIWKPR